MSKKFLGLFLLLGVLWCGSRTALASNCVNSPLGNGWEYRSCIDNTGAAYCVSCRVGAVVCTMVGPGPCPVAAQTNTPAPSPAPVPPPVTVKPPSSAAFAQVESRGEFYFVTKDGRKLTGADADKLPLEEGTKVVTGSDGHLRATLPDNTIFTVGPNSDLVIDKFVYDPSDDSRTIMASLSKGLFRWVTGKTARHNPAQMKVTLPVGTLGIRGTDFEVNVQPDGSGSVDLYFGQLEITEKKSGFTFLLNAGEKVTFGADGSISRPIKNEQN